MVLINCYYYIINVDISILSPKYILKPTTIKIDGETVYDLIQYKTLEEKFFNLIFS